MAPYRWDKDGRLTFGILYVVFELVQRRIKY